MTDELDMEGALKVLEYRLQAHDWHHTVVPAPSAKHHDIPAPPTEDADGRELSADKAKDYLNALEQELRDAKAECDELKALFDLQWRREVEVWERWRAEGKIAELTLPDYGKAIDMLLTEIEQGQSRLQTMEQALRQYGSHLSECLVMHQGLKCTCGFNAALTANQEGGE